MDWKSTILLISMITIISYNLHNIGFRKFNAVFTGIKDYEDKFLTGILIVYILVLSLFWWVTFDINFFRKIENFVNKIHYIHIIILVYFIYWKIKRKHNNFLNKLFFSNIPKYKRNNILFSAFLILAIISLLLVSRIHFYLVNITDIKKEQLIILIFDILAYVIITSFGFISSGYLISIYALSKPDLFYFKLEDGTKIMAYFIKRDKDFFIIKPINKKIIYLNSSKIAYAELIDTYNSTNTLISSIFKYLKKKIDSFMKTT
ncbi:MAG: hypothetical protein H0Z32_04005 [Bacillaceae bacterium]|nr:hypothetical protein [Bacillaceae bacterium]